jgi:peptidoglycan/LPS O-acetylase OafA/YrhL
MPIAETRQRPLAPRATFSPAIDALRGLAALGVVVFHARVALWVGWREIQAHPANYSTIDRALAWLSVPTPFMGAGVMLFFVISGYCVHQPIAVATRRPAWGAFWRRRFLRIYPPYLFAVALSAGVAAAISDPRANTGLSALMLQNYSGAWNLTALASQMPVNPSLWSLPVEMEFYVLYPLVWGLAARWGWRVLAVCVGLFSLGAAVAVSCGVRQLDGNFALYWVVWCSGAWLREQHALDKLEAPSRSWTIAAGVMLIAAIAFTLGPGGALAPLCWGGVSFWLVWRCLAAPVPAPRWLMRGLERVGAWSYSLYLVHFPLLLLAGVAWQRVFGSKPTNFLVTLLGVAAIIPVAVLFHRLVERPSHAWARRVGAPGAAN